MKSYFLEAVSDEHQARKVLSELLPKQQDPWVLLTTDTLEVVAYLNLSGDAEENLLEGPLFISADMSARHFHKDELVISLLAKLKTRLGGVIRDDDDNVL